MLGLSRVSWETIVYIISKEGVHAFGDGGSGNLCPSGSVQGGLRPGKYMEQGAQGQGRPTALVLNVIAVGLQMAECFGSLRRRTVLLSTVHVGSTWWVDEHGRGDDSQKRDGGWDLAATRAGRWLAQVSPCTNCSAVGVMQATGETLGPVRGRGIFYMRQKWRLEFRGCVEVAVACCGRTKAVWCVSRKCACARRQLDVGWCWIGLALPALGPVWSRLVRSGLLRDGYMAVVPLLRRTTTPATCNPFQKSVASAVRGDLVCSGCVVLQDYSTIPRLKGRQASHHRPTPQSPIPPLTRGRRR